MLVLFLKTKQVKFQLSTSMTAIQHEFLLSEFEMIRYAIYIFLCTGLQCSILIAFEVKQKTWIHCYWLKVFHWFHLNSARNLVSGQARKRYAGQKCLTYDTWHWFFYATYINAGLPIFPLVIRVQATALHQNEVSKQRLKPISTQLSGRTSINLIGSYSSVWMAKDIPQTRLSCLGQGL